MPATAPASKSWPSSTSSSTLSESISSTFDNPWVSPDCPAECAPRLRRVEGIPTSREVTSGDRRGVPTIRGGREPALDEDAFFLLAAVRRSVPDFLPVDLFLRIVFFFLAMWPSLSPARGIAPASLRQMLRAIKRLLAFLGFRPRRPGSERDPYAWRP